MKLEDLKKLMETPVETSTAIREGHVPVFDLYRTGLRGLEKVEDK